MTLELKSDLVTGNSETVVVVDEQAASLFWGNYFTHSYVASDDDFLIVSKVDLMGNPIPQS